ncbi:hypothetical protein Tco_0191533 [Tanacetum coccineum]
MANQEQNLLQQEQPFVAAKQVSFNLKGIILNTNNGVALLYPKHTTNEYFKCVSDFISKCCLRKPFTKSPNMYQEYMAEFWYLAKALENSKVSFSIPTGGIYEEVGLNIFRNVNGAHYLPHSSEYVAPPSIDVVRKWFPTIGYGEEVSTKGTLKKSLLPPRWSLANGIHIDYANIFWEDIILKLKKKQREKVVPYTRFLSLLIMHKMKEDYGIHEKPTTSSKQPSVSSKEATKGRSSKAPTGSKTSHSKKRKESSSAMDSNPSLPSVSTPLDTKMHKEDQQATGGPTSLGVTSEERANPQLSSGHDVLVDFTTEADPGLSAPNDSIPPQQGMDEGTKNTSYDHIFAGTDTHVLADQTKSVSEGLEIVLTQPTTEKGASFTAIHGDKEEASNIIKLEDLAKLVSQIQPSFKDLDSPEDDPNDETEDTSVTRFTSPRSSQTQELTNQVLILQSQKYKLELEKNKDEAEAALLKAQTSFPNVEKLNELLVKSLQTKFSEILSSRDFSSSLPTELKDLPSKFNELTEEIKGLKTQVHELEIELPKELKEIPTKLEDFTKTATSLTSHVAELKTLYLLLNVTKALNKFVEALESTPTKAGDQSVPLAE